MVLGQHGVGGIRGVIIMEDDVLLLLAALDDLIGSSHELTLDILDERHDHWRNEGEDKTRQLLLQLLDDLGQDWNSFNCGGDALHDFVVELDGRLNLTEDILDVHSELLGLSRRHGMVLHLSIDRILLELVDLVTLMLVAEEAIWDVVKEITQHAGVSSLGLLESALKLINLILSQLVGDCHIMCKQCFS